VAGTLGECRLDEWWFRLDCVGGGWRIVRGGCDKLGFSIRIHYPHGVGALYT